MKNRNEIQNIRNLRENDMDKDTADMDVHYGSSMKPEELLSLCDRAGLNVDKVGRLLSTPEGKTELDQIIQNNNRLEDNSGTIVNADLFTGNMAMIMSKFDDALTNHGSQSALAHEFKGCITDVQNFINDTWNSPFIFAAKNDFDRIGEGCMVIDELLKTDLKTLDPVSAEYAAYMSRYNNFRGKLVSGKSQADIDMYLKLQDDPEEVKKYFAERLATVSKNLSDYMIEMEAYSANHFTGKLDTGKKIEDFVISYVGRTLPKTVATSLVANAAKLPDWARTGLSIYSGIGAAKEEYEQSGDIKKAGIKGAVNYMLDQGADDAVRIKMLKNG